MTEVTQNFDFDEVVPAIFTADHKSMMYYYDENGEEVEVDGYFDWKTLSRTFHVFDSSFKEIKTFTIDGDPNIKSIRYMDLTCGYYEDWHYTYLTQTLFNNDSKFEYLVEEKYIDNGWDYLYHYKIMQDDGTLYANLEIEGVYGFNTPRFFKTSDGVYMRAYIYVTESDYQSHDDKLAIYKLESSGSGNGVLKLREVQGVKVSPRMAERSETVSVEVPEEVERGTLVVTNAAGATLMRTEINGQHQFSIPTRRMSAGVYNVSVINNGNPVSSTKIVIR